MAMRRGPREATQVWDDDRLGGMDNDDALDGQAAHEQFLRTQARKAGAIKGPAKLGMSDELKNEFKIQTAHETHIEATGPLLKKKREALDKLAAIEKSHAPAQKYEDEDEAVARHEKLMAHKPYVKAVEALHKADNALREHAASEPPESMHPDVTKAREKVDASRRGTARDRELNAWGHPPETKPLKMREEMERHASQPSSDEQRKTLLADIKKKEEAHKKAHAVVLWHPKLREEKAAAKHAVDAAYKKLEAHDVAQQRKAGALQGPLLRGKRGGTYYWAKHGGTKIYIGPHGAKGKGKKK